MAMVCVMLLSNAGQLCIAELLWDSILGGCPGPLLFPIGPAEGTPVKLLRPKRPSFCGISPPSGFPPWQQKQNVLGRAAFWSFRLRHFFTKCFSPQSLNLPVVLCKTLPPRPDSLATEQEEMPVVLKYLWSAQILREFSDLEGYSEGDEIKRTGCLPLFTHSVPAHTSFTLDFF